MDFQHLSPNTLILVSALASLILGYAIALLIASRRLQTLTITLAVEQEKNARIPGLEAQLEEKSKQTENLQRDLAGLQVQLIEQRKSMDEKLALLQQAEVQLTQRFENMANRILEEKAQTFA